MVGEERRAQKKAYYEANKEAINKKRRELTLVPSIRDAVNKRRREQYAAKRAASKVAESPPTIPIINSAGPSANLHLVGVVADWSAPANARLPTQDKRTLVLRRVRPCPYCKAYKFYRETPHFCCGAGQVSIASTVLPEYLVRLLTDQSEDSKDFHMMIRTYNNHFAYSSMSIHCDVDLQRRNHGIYTVRAQGQIHHFLNDLLPSDPGAMSGLHFYFYDPIEQVAGRTASLPRLKPATIKGLVKVMESSPYSSFLRNLSTLEQLDQYCIIIKTDSTLDQRVYNKPTTTEVAGIWIEDESVPTKSYERDIRVYAHSGHSHNIQYYYSCYDPLQYVLMFPAGEPGWHGNIPTVGSVLDETQSSVETPADDMLNGGQPASLDDLLTNEIAGHNISRKRYKQGDYIQCGNIIRTNKRSTVSCRQYYSYKLQIRLCDTSYLLRFGRLLQQYVVDMYIKIEAMRLAYFEHHQDNLRVDHYKGVQDSVVAGIVRGECVGMRVYLPATFIGGPRDMRHRYLDSMSLVQQFGRPDIFLTITCNSNWPEIKECLARGEEAQNRPDLVVRVFKARLSILHDRIMKDKIFGEVASVVHVVEFQKRGLPHAHFLIILKPSSRLLTPEAYDRFVCAELPDKHSDPYLYSLVVRHMMHGPCGQLNSENVCMRDGKCKNHYPKPFSEHTVHGKGSYPVYQRRDNGRSAMVRGHSLDNCWVIPYNPALLAEFNCHINIEICCDIRVVKYLYKYVHKGHDRVAFRINPDNAGQNINEIDNFRNARWVSPPEAVWRIYGFPLSGMWPSVVQLQVHLPDFQTIRFEDDADLEELMRDERSKRSMLTEFFHMNATDAEVQALNCLYKEFPSHYVWNSSKRKWTRRKKGVVVGRMCTVNPCENERYYLRILLLNVRCPKSFEDLLTVDGVLSETNQESAYKRGLLHQDDDIDKSMEEASIYQMPLQLRMLFATLLYYCKPSKPQELFQKFYSSMAEDFVRNRDRLRYTDGDIMHKVLFGINDTLKSLGKKVDDYHIVPFSFTPTDSEQMTREVTSELSLPVPDADLQSLNALNEQQRYAFDVIFNRAMADTGGGFFIDGPGGTGKSFIYKVLLAHIRSRGFIALAVATSGIASSCFLGGRTAHSRFKIPIDISSGGKCQVSFQSGEAYLIRNSRIIIWDEAPMAHRTVIEALDKLLRDLCKKNVLFGGKLVVFGGDFRQVLPVVRGGNRIQQVSATMMSSTMWPSLTKITLTHNMRAREDPGFVEYLMRIGNGEEPVNSLGQIELPAPMVIPYTTHDDSLESLISCVYPHLDMFVTSPFTMMKRAILSPKNEFVDNINQMLIDRFAGNQRVYVSDDRAKHDGDQGDYLDYLNSLEPRGLPQHRLILKENCPVVLLRNINPLEGLCNGTRLICKDLKPHVVGAIIATGQFAGKYVWIPRIPLEPNPGDNKYLIPFVRKQLPLRLCFAMTINKAQGQTLDYVGLYLRQPVFSHGQLYVALSRARRGDCVKVLIVPPTYNDEGTRLTSNVVYTEVLAQARAG